MNRPLDDHRTWVFCGLWKAAHIFRFRLVTILWLVHTYTFSCIHCGHTWVLTDTQENSHTYITDTLDCLHTGSLTHTHHFFHHCTTEGGHVSWCREKMVVWVGVMCEKHQSCDWYSTCADVVRISWASMLHADCRRFAPIIFTQVSFSLFLSSVVGELTMT